MERNDMRTTMVSSPCGRRRDRTFLWYFGSVNPSEPLVEGGCARPVSSCRLRSVPNSIAATSNAAPCVEHLATITQSHEQLGAACAQQ